MAYVVPIIGSRTTPRKEKFELKRKNERLQARIFREKWVIWCVLIKSVMKDIKYKNSPILEYILRNASENTGFL